PVVSDRVLALEEDLALSVDAFPTGTVVTLVDGHGTILARSSDGERWIGYNIRSTGLDVLAQQGQKGRAEARGVDGVLRQYGFTRIDGSDWALYVGIPAGIARSAVRDTISRGAAAGIIICLVVMLIALQLATTIKRPLDGLARAAPRVADEGYSGSVPDDGPREIAVVAQAFNRMIDHRSDDERALRD